ncbi:helix-turn-helix domain-containing protein [Spiroplasma endosymbiont of Labia minor]|uniref:helix-turn-helix domain-containing protein n=1 Tax=Spiroplasma endosymbiont of Labia minor TaxID=3066305 RepID=UPI0030CC619D
MEMISPKDKEKIIKEYEKSGVSAKNFAPTRNISDVSLRNWTKAYKANGIDGLYTKYDKDR